MNTSNGYLMGDARVTVTAEMAAALSLRICPSGSVIFPKVGGALHTNKKRVLAQSAAFDTNTMAAVPTSAINARFLYYWLVGIELSDYAYGSPVPQLSRSRLSDERLILPPLQEQRRIVAAVEEQFSRLDAGVAALERVRRNLRRMRAAVFHGAAYGRLVGQQSEDESAALLLSRINELRDRLLANRYPNEAEAATQRRKQAQQRLPKGLPALPMGWEWATLMQCSGLVIDCRNKTVPYAPDGVILLRTTNIRDGAITLADERFVDEANYLRWSARYKPSPGDIVITREAPMGEVAIIPEGMTVCLGQRLMLASLIPDTMDPKFLLASLRDPALMDRVQDKPVGVGVQHLRVGGVETLLVPVPPRAEQKRIVAEVERFESIASKMEALLKSLDFRLRMLRMSILHAAFSGQLVPQDPTDEPASALLERVAAERVPSSGQRPSRSRKSHISREKVKL